MHVGKDFSYFCKLNTLPFTQTISVKIREKRKIQNVGNFFFMFMDFSEDISVLEKKILDVAAETIKSYIIEATEIRNS